MSEIFPLDFDPRFEYDGANDNSLMKDGGFMDLQTGDGSGSALYGGSTYGFAQQSNQAVPVTDKPNPHLTSHRGSTSSSSSLRSNSSNSPHTSIDAMPMEASPGEWREDIGGHGDVFDLDSSMDMSQFITLPSDSSSPVPPVDNEPSPEFHTASEALPQGRPIKRRKAQSKQRTGRSSNRSTNKIKTKSSSEFSPISAQPASSESSPIAMYNSNVPSPEGNFNNFADTFGGVGMSTNWSPTTNGQMINPLFPLPRSDSAYIPPANYDLQNGNPPSSLSHSPLPRLVIHPMPVKSRVETQIPLKITLHNLPKGIRRVHLPTHTIAKPKLLQKPSTGPSPDMLELTTMLVCTSAVTDETRLKRAFGRAARKPNINEMSNPVDGIEDEENKPQNGGEVRICVGCITRERKRAGRKKHKKPEEEELWDRYERERAIVFNTLEVKEWQTVTAVMADPTGAGFINGAIPEGTVQVDAPMRIACYCRHHGEKLGFQVIITLKDCSGNIIAQGISSSIMITDDHKTPMHAGPAPTPQPPSQPQLQHQHSPQSLVTNGSQMLLQAGIPQPVTTHPAPIQSRGVQPLTSFQPNSGDVSSLPFRQNHSTPDLQSQGQNPLAISPGPQASISQSTSTAVTPRNLSRQTSPASPLSAGNRKRKASMVGKVPTGLAMTKIETNQPLLSMPPKVQNDSAVISAGNSPFSTTMSNVPLNGDLLNQGQQHMLNNVPHSLGAGPATPNNNGAEPFVFTGMNGRVMSLERPVNQMFSAPVSAHPSRAPSPSQLRLDPQNLQHSQRPQDVLPGPLLPLPAILRIIPNEGSKCGGAEITVLGSNFTNDGLEVYFGSQRAITTTYWGPTSLVCMLPPSPVSGPVPVMIKQPGRRQGVQQPAVFKYKDDDEDQLIRTALGVLANQFGRVLADPADFARTILYSQTSASGSNNQGSHGNGNNTFTHFSLESGEAVESSLLRILEVMDLDENPNKARINIRRSSGQTMLHLACSLGFVRFVAGLLSRGANVHIRDKGGFTPLHMAAMNDHPEIVRRLVAKGADRNVRSRSGLTPMDVARSLPVRRSLQHVENHHRSRSADSRLSRASSLSSVRSLWEPSAITPLHRQEFLSGSFDAVTADNGDDSSEETTTEEDRDWLDVRGRSLSGLRRRSTVETHAVDEADEGPASPSATMAAIREQVATQLQQFQHTMAMHLQNLPQFQMPNIPQMPNLPPMPILPGYQAYLQSAPVMQRISSLVPNIRGQRQEPAGDHTSNSSDNKWGGFPFFGNKDSPPAYEDIFPQKDLDIKQASAARAAAEFEADAKCATLFDQDVAEASQAREVPTLLQIGRKHLITKEQQETLQRAHAQRLKAGSSDKMLWFVWIPILVLVLGAMLWSGAPSLVSGTTSVAKVLGGLITNPRDISNRVRNIIQELA
ncbi:hypothetical protein E0Z10_g2704 [Xylaria hypoxylon]|uniref:IPT/TIG domain-containing protein n=1 Tax=Xylaria hypoxylon TaxID=37992 RepID=A0A4Z0Z1I3_9PEZI|nr:hypothetical protein E0Z10_g2704 [Xylaria hypoxylon]